MSDLIDRQAAIDAILEDLNFDSVKELRAYVAKNKQDDYFYGGILYAINAVQDLPSAQPVARDTNVLSNDTISRQDAIRIVDGIDTWQAGWRGDAIESMKALPSAQPEPHWIPVSEGLPDACGYYLTSTENDEVYCDYWDTEKFDQWFDEGHFDRLEKIVAWMPLPEPYKKGGEQE